MFEQTFKTFIILCSKRRGVILNWIGSQVPGAKVLDGIDKAIESYKFGRLGAFMGASNNFCIKIVIYFSILMFKHVAVLRLNVNLKADIN